MKKIKPRKGILKPTFKKVRILTIKGKPWGAVIAEFIDNPRRYETSYWVRLDDGTLLKDLQKSELEFDYERLQAKCVHEYKEQKELGFFVCQKCNFMVEDL